ncbi:uncharacterized protein A4U43_C07F18240 [Asparagus officinalis]|uniref:RING-type E3 ubiquitin transferase n=1 Tax=Asparagus officinalis TaxID=4686 RepID=A0A5P1ED00_ASPOF|nr:probable E3 ubiquitin-protein ligase LUL4 [Asparagus officinalis]ONK63722.1 uncharacterized protein A4U43_C07F18240 [Asparagus officinalis]
MGQSSSSQRRRRGNNYPQQPYSSPPPPPPPPATSYPYSSNPSYYHPNPPPPPPYSNNTNSYSYQLAAGYNTLLRFLDTLVGRNPQQQQLQQPHYYYYGPPNQIQGNGSRWVPSPSPASSSSSLMPPPPPPQYVEQQEAKTVRNDVNVHKDTVRLALDHQNPDHYLVSFVFDATLDGSITIYYFAQEGANGDLSPVYADMHAPKRFPFQKGFGQEFHQPAGSGIDLGFFELDDLSKPLNGDIFPLVIYAEACPQTQLMDEQVGNCKTATCAQITQAIIQKSNNEPFQAKVVKQILWANGERYELQEIFGIADSVEAEAESNDDNAHDMGKECVICLSEPRSTAVLPCRHMCMCSECAKALRLQSNKCPVCRQPVEKLMEINVKKADH